MEGGGGGRGAVGRMVFWGWEMGEMGWVVRRRRRGLRKGWGAWRSVEMCFGCLVVVVMEYSLWLWAGDHPVGYLVR